MKPPVGIGVPNFVNINPLVAWNDCVEIGVFSSDFIAMHLAVDASCSCGWFLDLSHLEIV
jgi:hypothetical protein